MRQAIALGFCLLVLGGYSQTKLTLEQAFQSSLKSNYGILILQNNQEVAENSANIGNAGMLPNVDLNASYGGTVTDTRLEFAGDTVTRNIKNALSENASAGATVSYVLFNGLQAQHTYKNLMLNAASVRMETRAQIELTLLDVASAYYDLARAIESQRIAMNTVNISSQRHERAKTANELGSTLRTELLTARVALTSDSAAFLEAELVRLNAQRTLEMVTGLRFSEFIETADVEMEMNDWTLEQLQMEAKQNNATLKNAELQIEIAKKDYDLSWSTAFPSLSVSGGYQYTNQQTEAGLVLSNTQSGWNGNVSLNYPIFTGFRNRTVRQNSRIAMETSELRRDNEELTLLITLENSWNTYLQSIRLYDMEVKNLASAELNLQRLEELFKAGQSTSTEFRAAQLSFDQAQQRINNAAIKVKLNELKIMQLTGQVLKKQSD